MREAEEPEMREVSFSRCCEEEEFGFTPASCKGHCRPAACPQGRPRRVQLLTEGFLLPVDALWPC